jgi:hypothetical protein
LGDAAIYPVPNGMVQPIGLAAAAVRRPCGFPSDCSGSPHDIRLVSAPIGSNSSHATDPLLIRPGQLVELTLDNNFRLSGWVVW